ncbi:ribosomal protein S6 [Thermanaerovibrio velox DSM 12556]|uniref:Small ribosomal subunit protein bS6 n=1 Tax=Thermanaerovibrio velox DSM 12556 TaxID=926567 RepID=H0USI3_9BACT|nr:30S ribosomal protein S6 [Thermanaerovibrio velox]EHM10272.1 ribosomal protein S6 [Thermanaerovibrio velox DSM 12556]
MRPYELVTILTADLEDPKSAVEELAEVLKSQGAEVEKVDLWGKRRLAYPIAKKSEGIYALYTFKQKPSMIKEMERVLRLKPQVMRHLVISRDEK